MAALADVQACGARMEGVFFVFFAGGGGKKGGKCFRFFIGSMTLGSGTWKGMGSFGACVRNMTEAQKKHSEKLPTDKLYRL